MHEKFISLATCHILLNVQGMYPAGAAQGRVYPKSESFVSYVNAIGASNVGRTALALVPPSSSIFAKGFAAAASAVAARIALAGWLIAWRAVRRNFLRSFVPLCLLAQGCTVHRIPWYRVAAAGAAFSD